MRINKEILRLAIPNIISNISIPLLSTVDTILMGRMSAAHLGAVGLGSMIFNFIYWNFGFLRMGTTGMTAQAYGRNDHSAISANLGRASFLALFIAFLIMIIQVPLFKGSCFLMNVSDAQLPLISEYFFTRLWAAPATLLLYGLLGWFFGMQNAIIPLFLTILINACNIIISYYLVKHQGLGIKGVAIGTVVAQYIGVLTGILLLFMKYKKYWDDLKLKSIFIWEELVQFLNINKDLFVRTVLLTFAFGFFYSQSSKSGEIILAVNVVLLQFVNWMSYGIDGFAYAAESIVGKYKGKEDDKMLNLTIKKSFFWGAWFSILYALIYWGLGDWLLTLFTKDQSVISIAQEYMIWMAIFPILSYPSYLWDGVFIGLTASKAMRNSMILSLLIYLGAYHFLEPIYGNHGLWLALLLLMVARGIFQWYLYRKYGKEIK